MNEEFMMRLSDCGSDRNKLLQMMAEIDAEKRSIKSHLFQLSSEPEGFVKGRKRQVVIRKLKDKNSFLTEEREAVRAKLASLVRDKKAFNRAVNSRNPEFSHAFLAAAERVLSEEQFLELELRATDILLDNK